MELSSFLFVDTQGFVLLKSFLFNQNKDKLYEVLNKYKANHDDVTTQLYWGSFVVVVVVKIVVVVLIVFVAVHIGY